ncbi:MAG: MarR family winged helix-turn-helix transcriptional regulator, partial [Rhizomicrobium sp.]
MRSFYRAPRYRMKNSVGYLVHYNTSLLRPQMERLFDDRELTFSQWTVLMALREWGDITAAHVARRICHDAGSLTRLLDQLERRGLVARTRNKTDRRAVALSLTARGKSVLETVLPRVVDFWNRLLGDFTESEIRQTISLLTRLAAASDGRRDSDNPRKPRAGGRGGD